jgi:hypothetical protein
MQQGRTRQDCRAFPGVNCLSSVAGLLHFQLSCPGATGAAANSARQRFSQESLLMKSGECLLTVALSVTTTLAITEFSESFKRPSVFAAASQTSNDLVVDRLIVRRELIVSDTESPWEAGFEDHQIPRGVVIRSLAAKADGSPGTAGLWVRSRLIKTEIDDPFDDRFHAINRDGSMFRAPGHISWNVWLDHAWRQAAIIQGEILEPSEIPPQDWSGANHPGRLRFQSFRPNHSEPLTDAVMGQGMMSIGGGGYGGGGLPYPSEVLQLWGGTLQAVPVSVPSPPRIVQTQGSIEHTYALIAVGPQGQQSEPSQAVACSGSGTLEWDSVSGADSYIIVRDGRRLDGVLRIEGSVKSWIDRMP